MGKICLKIAEADKNLTEGADEELQLMADGLTKGEFGPPGAYNVSHDHAPERQWKPSDPNLNQLYLEYAARHENAGKCLQSHSVFFVGR